MRDLFLITAFVLLIVGASAQEAAGSSAAVVSAATNSDLATLSASENSVAIRIGVMSPGDAPALIFIGSNGPCGLNSGRGDVGSQVPSRNGKCWVASYSGSPDVREWGAHPDNGVTDAGPGLRAACAYAAASQATLSVPKGIFVLKTLDLSGLGAIVLGTGKLGEPAASCNLSGEASSNDLANDTPQLSLGEDLNRPLLYVQPNTRNALWTNVTLNGNRSQQSGWKGGPNGKLVTVQIADFPSPTMESAIRFDRVIVYGGYNGDLYLGAGRGELWIRDSWFQYSGQTASDLTVWLAGYDATFNNVEIGPNDGIGLFIAEGSQYQITDGAVFMNAAGLKINGGKVAHLSVQGTHFQDNACSGITVMSSPPFKEGVGGGHLYSNLVFDGNSRSSPGSCSDVTISDSDIERFSNVVFMGTDTRSGPKPKFNIELVGRGAAYVKNVSFGTDSPNVSGFTNNPAGITGDESTQRNP